MKAFIRSLFLIVVLALPSVAFGQASILPPAKTTFLDRNGNPLTAGSVTFYIPNTTTFKTTWQDATQGVANTNPVVLDAAGSALIYGNGSYRQVVRDRNGNIIWDQVTASYQPSGSESQGGDRNFVGTVLVWAGLTAPTNYQFAYGQELLRANSPDLFNAITESKSVTCSAGSNVISVADTQSYGDNTKVEASCLSSAATITAKTSGTITVSLHAVTGGAATARFFPWGNGNGSTTFNLPDLRASLLTGRSSMGGVESNRLPSEAWTDSIGNLLGGNGTQTLTVDNLPAHHHSYSGTTSTNGAHTHTVPGIFNAFTGGGSSLALQSSGSGTINTGSAGDHSHTYSGTTNDTGSNTSFSVVNPSTTINFIIKVLPDSN